MKAMPDNSVDSIVTDPPYELGFMGKSWDASGIAFNVEVWREALRVIKPGGHLIAFSGSRTYHRMAVAIEDAGFQIRDQIMWVYGSGFPKSHNISKGIDKAAGAEREVVGQKIRGDVQEAKLKGSTYSVADANKNNNAIFGYGVEDITVASTLEAKQWDGWGTALKPAHEPMVLARKPLEGTVANNVLTYGVGGLNIDGTRVGTTVETWPASRSYAPGQLQPGGKGETQATGDVPAGRFPANFIHDGSDEVVALFPDTGKSTGGRIGKKSMGDVTNVPAGEYEAGDPGYGDSGSAARFFYCAKASKRDRNEGLDGFEAKRDHDGRKDGGVGGDNPRNRTNNAKLNHHPTVKPTSLMQYLVRLVTPPNGIVLDPFMGSGSTGKACAYEGFEFIGIDQSAEYVAIAQARIDFALADKSDELPL
jgi:site-specific DNA-methyltransferase (adenine-specific)